MQQATTQKKHFVARASMTEKTIDERPCRFEVQTELKTIAMTIRTEQDSVPVVRVVDYFKSHNFQRCPDQSLLASQIRYFTSPFLLAVDNQVGVKSVG